MSNLKRILLVEDNPNDVELTLNALEESQLANEVVVTRDGEEGLDYLLRKGKFQLRQPGNPVVVLLDVKMPKMNGVELLKIIRETEGIENVPVVMLTSSREEFDINRCYELGASAYVVKPVDFDQFKSSIRELGLFWAVINQPPAGSIRDV